MCSVTRQRMKNTEIFTFYKSHKSFNFINKIAPKCIFLLYVWKKTVEKKFCSSEKILPFSSGRHVQPRNWTAASSSLVKRLFSNSGSGGKAKSGVGSRKHVHRWGREETSNRTLALTLTGLFHIRKHPTNSSVYIKIEPTTFLNYFISLLTYSYILCLSASCCITR
jgi:hypothetical protein